ncbi:MAG: GerW family sporulation protein [Halanaerobiaceae bacterium]
MEGNTIEKLMDTAMANINEMVDVNTIVGDPVETIDGSVIIPISRVCFGFAAGGGSGTSSQARRQKNSDQKGSSFSGGSGGGVMLKPIAFLVVNQKQVRLLPVNNNASLERLINVAPEILQEIKSMMKGSKQKQSQQFQE